MWPFRRTPVIEFLCESENFNAIPPPLPASKVIPEWYKNLPPVDLGVYSAGVEGVTIKRCMPFMTAMTEGWIVFTPADIRVELSENGHRASTGQGYPVTLVEPHYPFQYAGAPFGEKVILKIQTQWVLRTAPGWSALVTQPFNRPDNGIHPLTGIIDADTFTQQITPPLYFTREDGLFTIPKGTPLVQVIPFKRQAAPGVVRVASHNEIVTFARQGRAIVGETGWYRKHAHVKRSPPSATPERH